jgi:DNA-binding transcriptional MocR family regulator
MNINARRRMSQPRVAEMVADVLRVRIVDGELADGDLLPRQEDLVEEFGVSLPSLREAMRILETEGLISVRRGNIGGAVVHRPTPQAAAYMLGLVLQSHRVVLGDGIAAAGDERFDLVLLNPPIRAGKKVFYPWLGGSRAHLQAGGALWVVVRTSQGARSLRDELRRHFPAVEDVAMDKGYRLYCAR